MGLHRGCEGVRRENLFDQIRLLWWLRGAVGLGEFVLTLSLCLEVERGLEKTEGQSGAFLTVSTSVRRLIEKNNLVG